MRKFKGGAVRDTAEGKLSYYGFRHPLVEQSFAKYMEGHQTLPDGSKREANNWWGGWSTDISLQSMIRHLEDLQALHAGYNVYEIRFKDGRVEKSYRKDKITGFPKYVGDVKVIDKEECLNAIKFNVNAYLLEMMKNNDEINNYAI